MVSFTWRSCSMEERLDFEKPKKNKIKGLPTTIVSGIFLTICLICLAIAYSVNLNQTIQNMVSTSEDKGAAAVAAVFVVLIIILLIFGLLVLPVVLGIPSLVMSIANIKKAEIKAIKILGIVFTSLSALTLIGVVLRLVLLFAKVM